jgi:hypothetical protein
MQLATRHRVDLHQLDFNTVPFLIFRKINILVLTYADKQRDD